MSESANDAVPRVDGERRVVDAEDLQVDVVAEACRMPLCNAGSRAIEHAVSARMRIPPPRSARQMRTSHSDRALAQTSSAKRSMEGGSVDELLDVTVERPVLDQLQVEVGRTLEDRA